jgi:hypothetical protein
MKPEEIVYFGLCKGKAAQGGFETAQVKEMRKSNVESALKKLREVQKLPNKGLKQAFEKCNKISEAVNFLKDTRSPKYPFNHLRQKFRRALRAERQAVLNANDVKSCGAVKNLVASLPPSTPEPATAADEVLPVVDGIDPELDKCMLSDSL